MPQLDAGTTNRAELLKQWRQALGYTQRDLAAILGVSNFHICEQERHREPTTARTINHLALVYAIHSLPPDAPVSIIQDLLEPPSALRRRQQTVQLLKARSSRRPVSRRRTHTARNPTGKKHQIEAFYYLPVYICTRWRYIRRPDRRHGARPSFARVC